LGVPIIFFIAIMVPEKETLGRGRTKTQLEIRQ
jgi:hypothetical protein